MRAGAGNLRRFGSVQRGFCGSFSTTGGLTANSKAERSIFLPSQRRRWPPQDIAVTRVTPPLPLPLTPTTPLVPNKTTGGTTTTAPRTLTPIATLTPRTTAFTTTKMENVHMINTATTLTVRFPSEPIPAQRHSSLRFLNPSRHRFRERCLWPTL